MKLTLYDEIENFFLRTNNQWACVGVVAREIGRNLGSITQVIMVSKRDNFVSRTVAGLKRRKEYCLRSLETHSWRSIEMTSYSQGAPMGRMPDPTPAPPRTLERRQIESRIAINMALADLIVTATTELSSLALLIRKEIENQRKEKSK